MPQVPRNTSRARPSSSSLKSFTSRLRSRPNQPASQPSNRVAPSPRRRKPSRPSKPLSTPPPSSLPPSTSRSSSKPLRRQVRRRSLFLLGHIDMRYYFLNIPLFIQSTTTGLLVSFSP